jgi:hypothetical protein
MQVVLTRQVVAAQGATPPQLGFFEAALGCNGAGFDGFRGTQVPVQVFQLFLQVVLVLHKVAMQGGNWQALPAGGVLSSGSVSPFLPFVRQIELHLPQ